VILQPERCIKGDTILVWSGRRPKADICLSMNLKNINKSGSTSATLSWQRKNSFLTTLETHDNFAIQQLISSKAVSPVQAYLT
jgi:hypothetical protein